MREVVDLESIEIPSHQTAIVRKAMAEGTEIVFFASDPEHPTEGIYVRLPLMIQVTYKCSNCNAILNPRFYLADILKGDISMNKRCSCRQKSRIVFMGAEQDAPVVDRRGATGLEKFL